MFFYKHTDTYIHTDIGNIYTEHESDSQRQFFFIKSHLNYAVNREINIFIELLCRYQRGKFKQDGERNGMFEKHEFVLKYRIFLNNSLT